jgi:hypothetical protein
MNTKFVSYVVALCLAISGNLAFGAPSYELDRSKIAAMANLSLDPSHEELMDELTRQEQAVEAHDGFEQRHLRTNLGFSELEKTRSILTRDPEVRTSQEPHFQRLRRVLALNLAETALALFKYMHYDEFCLYDLERLSQRDR